MTFWDIVTIMFVEKNVHPQTTKILLLWNKLPEFIHYIIKYNTKEREKIFHLQEV